MKRAFLLLQLVLLGIALPTEPAQAQEGQAWSADPKLVEDLRVQRPEFNYDESQIPQYSLPDPLLTREGERVNTPAEWHAKRRPELLELFRQYVYGYRPAEDYRVRFDVGETRADVWGGAAVGKSVVALIERSDGAQFSFPFVVFIPTKTEGKVPAVVHINNRYFIPLEKAASEDDPFWAAKSMVERGYATASFHTSDVDPDRKDGYSEGIRSFLAEGADPTDNAWRSLSAWGWGASRVLDYLATEPGVDSQRVAVSGHSRGGKAALWAGCEDDRFAIAYSNNSGCGGAALSRRQFGETVERITSSFPHWFTPNFAKFAGKEEELPVDQHEVVALLAPRGVYIASADQDLWADPKGEYGSLVAAAPVFKLLGADAITAPEMPPLNRPRYVGSTGYHVREGGHGLGDVDWNYFLDFADGLLQ